MRIKHVCEPETIIPILLYPPPASVDILYTHIIPAGLLTSASRLPQKNVIKYFACQLGAANLPQRVTTIPQGPHLKYALIKKN